LLSSFLIKALTLVHVFLITVMYVYGYLNQMNRQDAKIAKEFFYRIGISVKQKMKQVSLGRRTIRHTIQSSRLYTMRFIPSYINWIDGFQ